MSKRIKYVYLQPGQVPPQANPPTKTQATRTSATTQTTKPPVMDGLAWAMLLAVAALWAVVGAMS
ncbi:hypothetical protein HMY34_01965 [Thiothrix subterranea]|uniref:hypothetical protein n=1 Tax=Thiothrix subterranea TaxID=2735563 RepID=UPI00192C8E5D|nr:hypothetical protein [Thiothrix subterranea]QQZ27613.1 hypothetical protein HMY34_01965 [Thiothrix subterranea]